METKEENFKKLPLLDSFSNNKEEHCLFDRDAKDLLKVSLNEEVCLITTPQPYNNGKEYEEL